MQFCWLQPEQRPVVEEVYLLLNYLCAKGTNEAAEDFEKRWNSLRPSLDTSSSQRTPALEVPSSNSSFPLLEHFSMVDSFQSENGDEILTVTETSDGLNFEYKWEQARAEQPYCSSSTSGPLGSSNPHYQDIYYPLSSTTGNCKTESLTLGVSPSQYKSDYPGVVPVLSAHSPSVSSEYYIRIEEPVECNISVEEATLDYSPELETKCNISMPDMKSPTEVHSNTYWPEAKDSKSPIDDSDASQTSALSVDPSHRQDLNHVESVEQLSQYLSPSHHDRFHCELTHSGEQEDSLKRGQPSESCHKSGSLNNTCVQETSHGISVLLSSPSLGQCDPYLEANQKTTEKNKENEAYYDRMDNLPKNIPRPHNITVDTESADCLLMGAIDPDHDISHFNESETINWTSNHSTNNNTLNFEDRKTRGFLDTYFDVPHTTPSSSGQSLWPGTVTTRQCPPINPFDVFIQHSHMEANGSSSISFSYTDSYTECVSYIQLCSEDQKVETSAQEKHQIIHPAQKNTPHLHIRENMTHLSIRDYSCSKPLSLLAEKSVTKDRSTTPTKDTNVQSAGPTIMPVVLSECVSECLSGDSISLVNIDDCSNGDIAEISSEMFADSPIDLAKVGDISLAHIPLHREIQNQDPQEFIDLASSSSPSEAFSPDAYHTSIQPKSLDSGYDTENNESPEFVLKDLEGKPVLSTSVESEYEMVLQMDLEENDMTSTSNSTLKMTGLGNRNQYRDSAYFSDYDAENEKSPCEVGSIFFDNKLEDFLGKQNVKHNSIKKTGCPMSQTEDHRFPSMADNVDKALLSVKQLCLERKDMEFDLSSSPESGPVITVLAPFPPEMGGCLTKESGPDDGLGVESEHSGEEPASESSSSTASGGSSTSQEATTMEDQVNGTSLGFSSVDSLGSVSTMLEVKNCDNEEDNPDFGMDGKNEENEAVEEKAEAAEKALLNVKRDTSLENILPALPENLDIRAPLGNCDEEDDTDDSDESDEELRSYNVQEQSEESEEEFTTVPMVVVSERSTRHLRSLLKMPSLLTQSFCDELERKKKAVSFFDDVTVFLFDQVSWILSCGCCGI